MLFNGTLKKSTSRRGFFKKLITGAGGLALANSLRDYLMPDQSSALAVPAETLPADTTIYGKYFLGSNGDASTAEGPVSTSGHSTMEEQSNRGAPVLPGATASIGWQVFEEPVCWETAHTHTHDELLIFRGMELHDLGSSFDAEIDLWMGEEMEKHTITSATVIFIPKGVRHAPLNFRTINKPVLFHSSPVHLP